MRSCHILSQKRNESHRYVRYMYVYSGFQNNTLVCVLKSAVSVSAQNGMVALHPTTLQSPQGCP